MKNLGLVVGFFAALLAIGCKKDESTGTASAASSVPTPSATPSPGASTAPAPSGALLVGLDPCLVGKWSSAAVSMQTRDVSVDGGANVGLSIADTGKAVLDFAPMAPINGKSGAANFDFRYSGTASATLTTKTRGSISSENPDYSGLKVSASFGMPGVGKMPIFKDKPVAELAKVAAGIAGAKAPGAAAAPPPGIDANPIFSTSSYTCEGSALTLVSATPAVTWTFKRAGA
jgi:hypothetical protein